MLRHCLGLRSVLVGCLLISPTSFASSESNSLNSQQQRYLDVRELQRSQKWPQAEKAMAKLQDYPLHNYLRYYQLRGQLSQTKLAEVEAFLEQNPSPHLNNAMQRRFLLELARRGDWIAYLTFFPKVPSSVDLRCYHYYAHYSQGNRQLAWQGAEELWLHGRSRPDACDPLFSAWDKAGQLSDELRWQRALLALRANQSSLAKYILRPVDEVYASDGKLLRKAYSSPGKVLRGKLNLAKERHQQIAGLALYRLARSDINVAIAHWTKLAGKLDPQQEMIQRAHRYLLSRSIFEEDEQALAWADQGFEQGLFPDLLERRLRISLAQQNWPETLKWIALLPPEQQQESRWRYWRARAQQQSGEAEAAKKTWLELASRRNFYGFMAAQRLQLPVQMRESWHYLSEDLLEGMKQQETLQRITELKALGELFSARSEWQSLLNGQANNVKLDYGHFALQRGWDDLAVQASIYAKKWDHLSLRFPLSYSDEFEYFALKRDIPSELLFAVARQESALYPNAQSSAGARGLMQLMPATAKETARKIGFRYRSRSQLFEVEDNIRLGSAYLKQLMDRYQDNRILATAAYNAGPHRVTRWLAERGDVDADIWIETIPFKETRGYVQNVLAYQLIYQHRAQRPVGKVLQQSELSYPYGEG